MPGSAGANAEFMKGLPYIACNSVSAIPGCLDVSDKPAGRGNALRTAMCGGDRKQRRLKQPIC